jgi:hypothetical protein
MIVVTPALEDVWTACPNQICWVGGNKNKYLRSHWCLARSEGSMPTVSDRDSKQLFLLMGPVYLCLLRARVH